MPWLETSPVDQRERFIRDHRLDLYVMAELCARYGISRKTGYKWLARFDEAAAPAWATAAGLRITARTELPETSPHCSCVAAAASELGAGQAPRVAAAAWLGRPSATRAISWPGVGWSRSAGGDGSGSIPASCRP